MENRQYCYANVRRWTRKQPKTDIFKLRVLLIPIHEGVHWTCACAWMQEKRICFYDSMGGSGRQHLQHIKQYIADEHMNKKETELDMDDWELTSEVR